MISISLSEKFCCQNYIPSIKVIDMTLHSSKTNKLRNINTIGCRTICCGQNGYRALNVEGQRLICIKVWHLRSLFLSPLAGKRDIVVAILVRCMCVRPCVRPTFVRTITCTTMHRFQNNLAQLMPLKRRSAF